MSRPAASKSRLEKTRGGTQATTPAIAHDIIPGKFTDQDWNYVIDADESEDFVAGLVEEVADSALTIIYDKYIERQLIPFTVALAKDAVLQIVEWYFLEHEQPEQEVLSNPSFIEDEEPPPVLVDAWAQGVMQRRPIKNVVTARESLEKIDEDLKVDQVSEESAAGREVTEFSEFTLTAETTEVVLESRETTGPISVPKPGPRPKQPVVIPYSSKRKVPFRPYNGRMKSAGVSKIEETLHETELRIRIEEELSDRAATTQEEQEELLRGMPASCHSILKDHRFSSGETSQVQMGRPPGNKEVVYDSMGNVVSVVRIEAEKLPMHTVPVDFKIVDPEVEASNARLDAIRRGVKVSGSKPRPKPKADNADKVKLLIDKLGDKALPAGQGGRDAVNPLPPSLVDTIVLAPGVVVKEHDQTRRGPRQPRSRELLSDASLKSLRPVKPPQGALDRNDIAAQLIDTNSISVKPMPKLAPIPSIPSQ